MDLTTFMELQNKKISNNDLKGMVVASDANELDWIIITSFGDDKVRGLALTSQPKMWQTTQAYQSLSDFIIREVLDHALDEGYTPTQAELEEIHLYGRKIARPSLNFSIVEISEVMGEANLESEVRGGILVHKLIGEQ